MSVHNCRMKYVCCLMFNFSSDIKKFEHKQLKTAYQRCGRGLLESCENGGFTTFWILNCYPFCSHSMSSFFVDFEYSRCFIYQRKKLDISKVLVLVFTWVLLENRLHRHNQMPRVSSLSIIYDFLLIGFVQFRRLPSRAVFDRNRRDYPDRPS